MSTLLFTQDSTGGQAAELRAEDALLNSDGGDSIFGQVFILSDEDDDLQCVKLVYEYIPSRYGKRIRDIIKEFHDEKKGVR